MAVLEGARVGELRAAALGELKRLKAEGKKVVGYFCLYLPVEMVWAAGAVPVRLAQGTKGAEERGERFLRADACPFCKAALGGFLTEEKYRLVDAVVNVNTCDMMRRLPEVIQAEFRLPVFQVYMPRTAEPYPNRVQAFIGELKDFRNWLAGLTGVEPDEGRLRAGIAEFNRLRERLRRIERARPGLKASELFDLVGLVSSLPPDRAQAIVDEVEEKVERLGEAPPRPARPRLLLAGSVLAEEDRLLLDLIEERADVVADTVCTGARWCAEVVELNGDPLESLARFYFNRIPCAYRRPNLRLYDHLRKLVHARGIQGIVYKTLLYCDPYRFEARRLRAELGLPVLEVDGNYAPANREQLRTRVQAFLEMFG